MQSGYMLAVAKKSCKKKGLKIRNKIPKWNASKGKVIKCSGQKTSWGNNSNSGYMLEGNMRWNISWADNLNKKSNL